MNTGFLGPAVATVLTVYGIETQCFQIAWNHCNWIVATVLTVYGIETNGYPIYGRWYYVATVLTVYGIETHCRYITVTFKLYLLQQYLPFTVLKPAGNVMLNNLICCQVATILTVYGIETYIN